MARFSPGLNSIHICTSSKLRPQPLQVSSPWLVEQIAIHGVSGVLAYQSCQACAAAKGKLTSSAKSCRWYTIRPYTSAKARNSGGKATPSADGFLLRQWLMAASMSVMWMPAMLGE